MRRLLLLSLLPRARGGRERSVRRPVAAPADAILGSFRGDSISLTDSGEVSIFEIVQGDWSQVEQFVPPGNPNGLLAPRVVHEGSTVIVSRPDERQGNKQSAGRVYVRDSAGAFSPLVRSNVQTEDVFGYVMDLEDDALAVGAARAFITLDGPGKGYLFERVGGVWTEALFVPAPPQATRFGVVVDTDGSTAVFGGRGGGGFAVVCERRPNGWQQVQILQASDAAIDRRFGDAVAVQGDHILVGSRDPQLAGSPGTIYAFERINGTWVETQRITPSIGAAGDGFGQGLALTEGLRAVVGQRASGPSAGWTRARPRTTGSGLVRGRDDRQRRLGRACVREPSLEREHVPQRQPDSPVAGARRRALGATVARRTSSRSRPGSFRRDAARCSFTDRSPRSERSRSSRAFCASQRLSSGSASRPRT